MSIEGTEGTEVTRVPADRSEGRVALRFERQPRESPKAFAAFKTYRDMGAERSLAKVAKAPREEGAVRGNAECSLAFADVPVRQAAGAT